MTADNPTPAPDLRARVREVLEAADRVGDCMSPRLTLYQIELLRDIARKAPGVIRDLEAENKRLRAVLGGILEMHRFVRDSETSGERAYAMEKRDALLDTALDARI